MNQQPPFELGPIRPVAEARSLLIRTTRGCPWNKCDFCVNYQDMKFSIRSVEEIEKDIVAAAEYYDSANAPRHRFASCFLQDGDSFLMKTADLIRILRLIREHFPSLERITSYGRAATMVRKSPEEMKEIREAGLNRLYCGMESGSDTILERIHKGATSADIIRAGRMAKDAGMENYNTMDDVQISGRHLQVAQQVAELQKQYPGREDEICHYLRERIV